jgi:hypothetical protein
MKTIARCAVAALSLLLFLPSGARGETDPRDYALILAKDHTNVFLTYARRQTSADVQNYVQNITLLRYLHVLKFGNLAVVPMDVVLPVVDAQVYIPTGTGTAMAYGAGVGDLVYLPTIGYAINQSEKSSTYFGFSPYFHIPLGTYDDKRAVNIGKHRWQFDEEVAIGQRFGGSFFVEALGAATFYTKNDDSLVAGTMTKISLRQSPTFTGTAHATANVSKEVWFGASYYYVATGKLTAETPEGDQTAVGRQTVQSLRLTVALRPVEPLLLLLQYQNDIAASGGATISRFAGVRVSYLF